MKRIICTAMALMLCLCLLAIPAFAASASASLTGPGTIRAGDTITLTFNLSGSGIFGASGTLSYDGGLLDFVSTSQRIGNGWAVEFNGNNFVAYDNNLASPINGNTPLFTVTFRVKGSVAPGTAINVSYTGVAASDGSADANIGTVTYSTTVAAPMSGDNALKSLTVSNATINPAFNPDTTNYTAEVPFEVGKLDIQAVANDGKAWVNVQSPDLTPNGTTNVTITVTAENGQARTYTISVKRAQDPNYVPSNNNNLASISVDGFFLSPGFSAENTSYVIWLPYETENVTVGGTPADSKASVTVEGGSSLVAGADNEVKVICTAEDGTQKIYTVIAKRAPAHDGSTEPTEPPTEPSTEPSTEPTTSAPTEPQDSDTQQRSSGIPWWVLPIVGVVCLAGGFAAGIFIPIKKKQ